VPYLPAASRGAGRLILTACTPQPSFFLCPLHSKRLPRTFRLCPFEARGSTCPAQASAPLFSQPCSSCHAQMPATSLSPSAVLALVSPHACPRRSVASRMRYKCQSCQRKYVSTEGFRGHGDCFGRQGLPGAGPGLGRQQHIPVSTGCVPNRGMAQEQALHSAGRRTPGGGSARSWLQSSWTLVSWSLGCQVSVRSLQG